MYSYTVINTFTYLKNTYFKKTLYQSNMTVFADYYLVKKKKSFFVFLFLPCLVALILNTQRLLILNKFNNVS